MSPYKHAKLAKLQSIENYLLYNMVYCTFHQSYVNTHPNLADIYGLYNPPHVRPVAPEGEDILDRLVIVRRHQSSIYNHVELV